MLRTIQQRLRYLVGSSIPGRFMIVAIAISLVSGVISSLIDGWLTDTQSAARASLGLALILIASAVALYNLPELIQKLIDGNQRPVVHSATLDSSQRAEHKPALIVLVSPGTNKPAANAIAHHAWDKVPNRPPTLKHCWLVSGPGQGEGSSLANAHQLAAELEPKGVQVEVWPLADQNDVEEVFNAVKTIFQMALHRDGYAIDEIAADYTGGTKSMTAGLLLAALNAGVNIQYMKPNLVDAGGLADGVAGSQAMGVEVEWLAESVSD